MSNSKPIGVAYLDQDISGADVIYSDRELGYTSAAQGTVTQATSKSTAVTLKKSAGRITTGTASITLRNTTGGALSEAVIINFALIHCL